MVFLSDNGASPEELPRIRDFHSHTEFFSPTTRSGETVALGNEPREVGVQPFERIVNLYEILGDGSFASPAMQDRAESLPLWSRRARTPSGSAIERG